MPTSPQARRCEYPLASIAQLTAFLLEPSVRSFFRASREASTHPSSTPRAAFSVWHSLLQAPSATLPRYLHATILRTPIVERGIADAVFVAKRSSRQAGLMLFQNSDDLFFGEPGSLHRLYPSIGNSLTSNQGLFRG